MEHHSACGKKDYWGFRVIAFFKNISPRRNFVARLDVQGSLPYALLIGERIQPIYRPAVHRQ